MATHQKLSWLLIGGAAAVLLVLLGAAQAQITLSELGTPASEDFTGYSGSGAMPHSPTPTPTFPGMLDSNSFAVGGMSDGNLPFGGSVTTGDFARGTTTGGEITGGMYAFDLGSGNMALGFQPTEYDMTPGVVMARVLNSTGMTVDVVEVSYELVVRNDEPRSTSWTFSWARAEAGPFTPVGALDSQTPEAADAIPSFQTSSFKTWISDLSLADGDFLYLRWQTDDVSGSGARDEIAIDTIVVAGHQILFDDGFETGDPSAWSAAVGLSAS